MLFKRLFFFLIFGSCLIAEEWDELETGLFSDLAIVAEVDRKLNDRLPYFYNYLMQGGYFVMPSARMPKAGNLGIGYAYLPPYQLLGVVFQLFDRLELDANYTIYTGISEKHFGNLGFGDDAERSANVRVALLKSSDGIPFLPEITLGLNDFFGTKRFRSFYTVMTKSFLDYDLELTLGWGSGRIHGFFAGGAWSPFRRYSSFFKDLSFVWEYDANNYQGHWSEHPEGRSVKSRLNAGIHLQLFDIFHFTASTLRGEEFAAQGQISYNLGETKGFFPKIYDPMPYSSPVDTEPLGMVRTDRELAQELSQAFKKQGFDLFNVSIIPGHNKQDKLWLKVVNVRYWDEEVVRERIQNILGALTPKNIETVSVVIEADGILSQEYQFRREDLKRFHDGMLSEYEFEIIAPLKEATHRPSKYDADIVYQRKKNVWIFTLRPIMRSYFGSTSGKFKFDVGMTAGPEGFIFDQFYYSLAASYTAFSNSKGIGSIDRLNPSQIINVRSDSILYRQTSSFHLDNAYLQKSWNLGKGCFYRLSVGYFEIAYAGAATEFLYYPVDANWAVGLECAALLKRSYHGLGFQYKIRKLNGFFSTYKPYYGLQFFLDFYYQYKPLSLDFKASIGQFLAWDKGIRLEGGRTFSSGLRLGLWVAYTNGNDQIGGRQYFEKGVSFSMPLDIFMNKSSRTRIGYAMSAWLRDVAAKAQTGKELYDTLYFERYRSSGLN